VSERSRDRAGDRFGHDPVIFDGPAKFMRLGKTSLHAEPSKTAALEEHAIATITGSIVMAQLRSGSGHYKGAADILEHSEVFSLPAVCIRVFDLALQAAQCSRERFWPRIHRWIRIAVGLSGLRPTVLWPRPEPDSREIALLQSQIETYTAPEGKYLGVFKEYRQRLCSDRT